MEHGMTLGLRGVVLAIALATLPVGCTSAYRRDTQAVTLSQQGQFGQARAKVVQQAVTKVSDRSYMLDRVKELNMALADGVPEAAGPIADRLYDFLRQQGVNEGNGFGSFVVGEGNARIWKGEPFEQAMGLSYIALLDGMNGDWGNVRAVASNSLFQIRDLSKAIDKGKAVEGIKLTNPEDEALSEREQLIAAAAEADKEKKGGSQDEESSFEKLQTPVVSNFALGYILKGIASRQLVGAFPGESEEIAAQLKQVAPQLGGLADQINRADYNTVLVVDYGVGPEKYRAGFANAVSMYKAVTPSSDQALLVNVGGQSLSFPVVTDLNDMAADLRWNNLEDVRLAKAYIGAAMVGVGLGMAAGSSDSTVQLVGVGLAIAGAAMYATAGADTRHNELLPQRSYVALLKLPASGTPVEVSVDGAPESRVVLGGLAAPPAGTTQLRYVRLPSVTPGPWATSGAILYGNDETGESAEANFPYILGGRCLRTPTSEVLASYQRSGYLKDISLDDLLEMYREEGISIAGMTTGQIGTHVAEGGSWLYTPRAGTLGFARLYGEDHPAYVPKSAKVKELASHVGNAAETRTSQLPEAKGDVFVQAGR